MPDYCVPVLLPLGSKELAAVQFSTNLALQRLTGSEGDNLISNTALTSSGTLRSLDKTRFEKVFLFCKCKLHKEQLYAKNKLKLLSLESLMLSPLEECCESKYC